ncbi:MAG: radical SAM protein, partial [Kiritimatiellales bacterium]
MRECKSSIGNLQSVIMSGLYIHIPFCARKCSYCAFYSISKPWKNIDRFFQTLEKELSGLPPDFAPETIFIGGGTPTAPDFQTLEKFLPN